MERLPKCRICLVENVRMCIVTGSNMHKLYESLTDIPFVTEDTRPMLACYFCYAKLEQCCKFQRQCLKAEGLFAQLTNEPNPVMNRDQLQCFKRFVETPIETISITGVGQVESIAIKEELPAFCESLHYIEPKREYQSNDLDIMEVKIEVDEEQVVLGQKRRASDTKNATIAKKPKEETRRTELEDEITEEQKENEKSDSDFVDILNDEEYEDVEEDECHEDKYFEAEEDEPSEYNEPSAESLGSISSEDEDVKPMPMTTRSSSRFRAAVGAAQSDGAGRRGRGRGRGARGQGPSGGPQWVRGERLVQVYLDDDDVPEDWRRSIMRVKNEREAARVGPAKRVKREREENEEEWFDADDGEGKSFFAAEGTSNRFEWSPVMADFQGEREQFLPQQTGAVVASENAYGAFRQYWDEDIMTHIIDETNRYAARLAASSATFARDWYDTNIHEIFVLFSFWVMLGIIRMPSIKSYFTSNPLLQTNIFRKMFTRDRYNNLTRALHFNDDSSRPTDPTDLLNSLDPIAERLNSRFQQAYIPSQNICIDESLTLWRDRLSFRPYIKNKAVQYDVKTFELRESSTSYLWSFLIHRGAGTSYDPDLPSTTLKSTTTVLNLMKPLLNKGYTLFMDNWFNSPLLARFLKTRKTDCVGTLSANRTDVPPLMSLCKMKDGQFVARHSGDVVVLAYQDKKSKIATISTYHGNSQGRMEAKPYRPTLYKPRVILDYNKGMGSVDRKDQMLEPYLLEIKKCFKWDFKFFKYLLNCSTLNARILLQSSTATLKDNLVFRLDLVDQILQHHLQLVPKSARPLSSSLSHPQPQVQHFPRQTDQLTNDGRHKRRRCFYCTQRKARRNTSYTCSVCEVPLCATPCFELYHTT